MVISGHSHMPKIETRRGIVLLNPGSAGPRRFTLPVTIATVDLSAEPLQPLIQPIVE
jgi:predicted phosphodiesterase